MSANFLQPLEMYTALRRWFLRGDRNESDMRMSRVIRYQPYLITYSNGEGKVQGYVHESKSLVAGCHKDGFITSVVAYCRIIKRHAQHKNRGTMVLCRTSWPHCPTQAGTLTPEFSGLYDNSGWVDKVRTLLPSQGTGRGLKILEVA